MQSKIKEQLCWTLERLQELHDTSDGFLHVRAGRHVDEVKELIDVVLSEEETNLIYEALVNRVQNLRETCTSQEELGSKECAIAQIYRKLGKE